MIKKKGSKEKSAPNRLENEKSPYLLQHAFNPVDWYPWGDEAFEKARAEDKPIFLSVGYSTCHWCHVMAHESFEDPDVANLMNEAFVSVKVDREERPDIDSAYMTAAQVMAGSGGWPLTIIMTPDKKPFFAATYIPKENRHDRVGMMDLIPKVRQIWKTQRENITSTSEKLTSQLKMASQPTSGSALDAGVLDEAFRQLSERFDPVNGGFSGRPKFPTPHNLFFLLRRWKRTGDKKALATVDLTLQKMRFGGIFDHLGFGFHRYSTDERWLVPHFEKMLYDQALLAIAYSEAYNVTQKAEYKETAREILTYVMRDLQSPEGGFFSAEDADSEGVEGKFYLWTVDEVRGLLSKEDAEIFIRAFNVESDGNYSDEATRRQTGKNILHLTKPLSEISMELGIAISDLKSVVDKARENLLNEREKRIRPERDEKILCDWNGLAIAGLAIAGRIFDDEGYKDSAKKAADFILGAMLEPNDRLLHRYKDGEAEISGFLEDYAFFVWGLLELYETTFNVKYLSRAVTLTSKMIDHFWDQKDGGFYHTPNDGEELILRKKEVYDGAVPSGNSVAMLNLLRLSRLTGNSDFEAKAGAVGRAFSKTVLQYPAGYTHLLSAVDFQVGPSNEIVIVGDSDSVDTKTMMKALNSDFWPNKVVLFKPAGEETPEITKLADFTEDHKTIEEKATAYVCSNFSCKNPTTDSNELIKILRGD
jgi:uncharacterized protein YyaL (SSP411 family)